MFRKMAHYRLFTALFFVIIQIACSQNPLLDEQHISEHPFSTLPVFSGFSTTPVIMKKYARLDEAGKPKDTKSMFFAPGAASFKKYGTEEDFCKGCDLLVAGRSKDADKPFVTFELNAPARVFVLLAGGAARGLSKRLSKFGSLPIENLPAGWDPTPIPLEYSGDGPHIFSTGSSFWYSSTELDVHAIAFEVTLPADLKFTLPGPHTVLIEGRTIPGYFVLFAKPGSQTDPAEPFSYASVPRSFLSHVSAGTTVNPSLPKPNHYCPDWVHDIYVTPNRAQGVDDEPDYFRTWHPLIDPYYWCYFDHEHGGHPSRNYRPMFGYTAWKTPGVVENTRQDESHKGFKVVPFEVPGDNRIVVITFHAHVSRARRFGTRHHTVIFAVVSSAGQLEAEIHLKMDYGPAVATLSDPNAARRTVPIDDIQVTIHDELRKAKKKAGRRINIINLEEPYPANVDLSYKLRDNPLPADKSKVRGLYEMWSALFPTCVDKTSREAVMRLDIRDAASSMRVAGDYDNMSWLNGNSMKRVLTVTDSFTFSKDLCIFEGQALNPENGIFYTNPYFTALVDKTENGGKNSVMQFIKDGFQPIQILGGQIQLKEIWSGPHTYDGSRFVSPKNIDGAINKKEN